jgi:hypothetical protein
VSNRKLARQACEVCLQKFVTEPRGRRRIFCSRECRNKARDRSERNDRGNPCGPTIEAERPNRKPVRALKNGARYPYSPGERNDFESPCAAAVSSVDFRGRAFSVSAGSAIRGPRSAVEVELIGAHTWREVVSDDGVLSHVTFVRRPALVEQSTKSNLITSTLARSQPRPLAAERSV